MRPVSFRCQFNFHNREEVDGSGREFCSRCGARQPKAFRVLSPEELQGRELIRPKTRAQRRSK